MLKLDKSYLHSLMDDATDLVYVQQGHKTRHTAESTNWLQNAFDSRVLNKLSSNTLLDFAWDIFQAKDNLRIDYLNAMLYSAYKYNVDAKTAKIIFDYWVMGRLKHFLDGMDAREIAKFKRKVGQYEFTRTT